MRLVPAALAVLLLVAAGAPSDRAYLPGTLLATLPEDVPETSGITDGARDDGVLFTHNDSSALPIDPSNAQVFATTYDGDLVATLQLVGIPAVDVEDIAWGPGADGAPHLFVADIGDNFTIRPQIAVYVLPEPELDPATRGATVEVVDVATYTLSYPGPRHDAETLLVHPSTGAITVVTKTTTGVSRIFTAPPPPAAGGAAVLTETGTLDLSRVAVRDSYNEAFPDNELQVTGGEISPDGAHVVLRTYTEGHEWPLGADGDVAAAVEATPVNVVIPEEQQGEAIGYRRDLGGLLTTSETTRTLHQMRLAVPAPEVPTPAPDAPEAGEDLPVTGAGAVSAGVLAVTLGVLRRRRRT